MLGYFSIIGLLRVHVLLGDFTLALKVMENVGLGQKVPSPHLRLYMFLLPIMLVYVTLCCEEFLMQLAFSLAFLPG